MDLKESLVCLFKGLTKSQIQPTNDLVMVKGQKSVWSLLMYVFKVGNARGVKKIFFGCFNFLNSSFNSETLVSFR